MLRNCGVIDPDKIDDYIARDGYAGLEKALFQMTPEQVIDEVTRSGLRGRGGAGFPTGKKWAFAAAQPKGQKYMVCNADEGDPGAYMDRSTLEVDSHSVIEAMAIAGYQSARPGLHLHFALNISGHQAASDSHSAATDYACLVKNS